MNIKKLLRKEASKQVDILNSLLDKVYPDFTEFKTFSEVEGILYKQLILEAKEAIDSEYKLLGLDGIGRPFKATVKTKPSY